MITLISITLENWRLAVLHRIILAKVLLIEMELMGPTPDGSVSDERRGWWHFCLMIAVVLLRRTLTLRSWLQNEQRTLSDAADVFGSLMLSAANSEC